MRVCAKPMSGNTVGETHPVDAGRAIRPAEPVMRSLFRLVCLIQGN